MPLPVLNLPNQPTGADLVRLFHKTQAAWVQHLAEPEELDIGTSYANAEMPEIADANHVRDAALAPGTTAEAALAMVDEHFREKGTRCAYWSTNVSAPPDQTAPLVEHLLARGHRPVTADILHLRQLPRTPAPAPTTGLKIVPARASYRHSTALAHEAAAEHGAPETALKQRIAEWIAHLDDPHVDALIALRDDRAVASVTVFAVGELSRIEHLYVAPDHRGQGLGRTMMARALEIAARSLFRHVFAVSPTAAALPLYRAVGFEIIGQSTTYHATSDVSARAPR